MKDPKRFSFSRFQTFQICPRKHHYIYEENIEPIESPAQTLGSLFHSCVELLYKNTYPVEIFTQYEDLCNRGILPYDSRMLKHVFDHYMVHYKKDMEAETLIANELEIEIPLDDDETVVAIVDRIVERDGFTILRDTKTTSGAFKHTRKNPAENQQLLFYVPYAEKVLFEKRVLINVVQIDEVRMGFLEEPLLLKNGRPTTDKNKLSFVTYEKYYELLCSMKLEANDEYQDILTHLKQRGHPLFRRTSSALLEPALIDSNMGDMFEIYKAIKQGICFRNRGPLCETCTFKQLCKLDMYGIDETSRNAQIDLIRKKSEEEADDTL